MVSKWCGRLDFLTISRMPVAENFRRRGRFEEIAFVFPNAPTIPITVVHLIGNT